MINLNQNCIDCPSFFNVIQSQKYSIDESYISNENNPISSDLFNDNITKRSSLDDINFVNKENELIFFEECDIMIDENICNNIFDICVVNQDSNSAYYRGSIKHLPLKKHKDEKEKIFRISKTFKGIGRIKKNTNYVGKHDKYAEDNIIKKIKGRFLEKCRNFVNYSYQKYLLRNNNNSSKGKMLLQKIEPKLSKEIRKKQNLDWFESKLYEVFSKNVSGKYSLYNKDYNKAQINLLFIRNEAKEIIDFLKKPIRSIYEDYINNKKVEGFETLKEDLKNLKKKMIEKKEENIDNYIKKYKLIAENLELIFIRKSSRNNNKKKKNNNN